MNTLRDSFTVEAQGDKVLTKTKHSSQTVTMKASRYIYDENGASQ